MRKYLIVFASASLVITAGAASRALFFGHPVQAQNAVTTLEPMSMHYGTMPVQEMSDLTFVFTK
jgi:hypothetical protein